jgi:NAD(P)H dehydrogenase (quinone)
MAIAVSGASGQLGSRIARELLHRVDPTDVVLLSRDPSRLDAGGAQARAADFTRPDTLPAAFEGVERMVLVSTDDVGSRTPAHRTAIEAAVAAGVDHIVYTSLPNPSFENPSLVTHEHAETEALLRESGLAWTFLRNGIYAEHQLALMRPALETGELVDNRGDGRAAYVTRDDCARLAAAVLASGGHEGAIYDVTGPELLSNADLAHKLSVARRELDDEAYAEFLRATTGMTPQRVEITVSMGRAIREGWMATYSTVVQDLTGREPEAFDDLVTQV